MTRLMLMRHAEACGKALDFWGPLLRLSSRGEEQAREASQQLYKQLGGRTTTVFVPNMVRHIQTAEIICGIIGSQPPVIDWQLGPAYPEKWDEMMMARVSGEGSFPHSWLEYARENEPTLIERERAHFLRRISAIRQTRHEEILIVNSSGLIEPVVGLNCELAYCELVYLP